MDPLQRKSEFMRGIRINPPTSSEKVSMPAQSGPAPGFFDHETQVEQSEKDLLNYGFLINRYEKEVVYELQTFGGEFVTVTLQQNEMYPVKVRKFISWSAEGTSMIRTAILWSTKDQMIKPVDPPVKKKSTDATHRDVSGNVIGAGISGRGF
jgi:hypothetical protein